LACRLPAGGSICSPDGASVVRVGRLQNRQLSDIACEKEKVGRDRYRVRYTVCGRAR
jgi:hypothetical protein